MNKFPLRLNLQFFADNDETKNESDEVLNENTSDDEEIQKDETKFTQAEVDKIVRERIAREKKAAADKAEKERLESQGEFKTLLEQANARIQELENEKAAFVRKQEIDGKLASKGLNSAETARYSKYVEKLIDSGEEVDDAIQSVYEDFVAVKESIYADPKAGFGETKSRQQKGDDEYGRELFNRLKRK